MAQVSKPIISAASTVVEASPLGAYLRNSQAYPGLSTRNTQAQSAATPTAAFNNPA
jgi:hypothetical protein